MVVWINSLVECHLRNPNRLTLSSAHSTDTPQLQGIGHSHVYDSTLCCAISHEKQIHDWMCMYTLV